MAVAFRQWPGNTLTPCWPHTFPGNRPGTLESYGTTVDGRAFYVVSTVNRKFVITVVELEEL